MEEEQKPQNKIVETYAADMAQVLQDDKGGLVKKIIHEEEAREQEKKNFSPESKKNKVLMSISIILLLVSTSALIFLFINRGVDSVPIEAPFQPMIFSDATSFIEVGDFSKDQILESIAKKVNASKVKAGGIEGLYLTANKNIIGLRQLVSLLKGNLDVSGNDFVSDKFMLGLFNQDKKDVFLLLQMRSMPDIFNNMHAWENKMFDDLRGVFGVTLTPETGYLLTKNFEDAIIQNKNARILYEDTLDDTLPKKIVLMYVFADDTHVVIADSESVVQEVILRLAGSQIKNQP